MNYTKDFDQWCEYQLAMSWSEFLRLCHAQNVAQSEIEEEYQELYERYKEETK